MILDTNAVSDLFKGDAALASILQSSNRHHLPVVVIGEYLYGIGGARYKGKLGNLLKALEDNSYILDTDRTTATHYAQVRSSLRAAGTPIPENDIWIAALARQHGLVIVSKDQHFDSVKDVERASW